MNTSPLSKLVNSWEYDLHTYSGFDWGEFGGIGLGGGNSAATVATLPITIQHDNSKLVIDLSASLYQYGGTVTVQIYLDDVVVRTAKVYLATENYVDVSTKCAITSISKGPHTLRVDLATSNATDLEIYEDISDGSFLVLAAQEIRK